MPKPRNILLIVTDQWRGDSLGLLGHPAVRTPHLDALARRGVTFTRHFGQSAPCGPARASLLTGLYVMNHRVVANGVPLDARHQTLPGVLRAAGLDPSLIGYTTTTPDPRTTTPGDIRFTEWGDAMDGWRVFAHFDEKDWRNYFGWVASRGHPLPDDPKALLMPRDDPPGPTAGPARIDASVSDTAWTEAKTLDFLRTTRTDRPWVLHCGFFRPHPPFAAPAPFHATVPLADIPAAIPADPDQHPLLAHWLGTQNRSSYFEGASDPVQPLSAEDIALTRRAYYGLIAEVDAAIGRIVAALDQSGQAEDTLIVFTTDHAEQLGDHGLFGKLGWFDQSYHLPLIVVDPSRPAAHGRRVDAFTEAVDVMPTILEWLSIPGPTACDGVSLIPWLSGETPSQWRDAVHYEFDVCGGWPHPGRTVLGVGADRSAMAAMRTADWKYVHFAGFPPVLHDLRVDPMERRNVAADPAHAGLLAEAQSRMLTWRMRHADRTLTHLCASPSGLARR
jgi:arylsulfatase A-like enzyme